MYLVESVTGHFQWLGLGLFFKLSKLGRLDQRNGVELNPQGTHGVIMVMDITKAWTMDYIRKEAEKVPSHIPILLLANFTDQGHHRQVPFSYPKELLGFNIIVIL